MNDTYQDSDNREFPINVSDCFDGEAAEEAWEWATEYEDDLRSEGYLY